MGTTNTKVISAFVVEENVLQNSEVTNTLSMTLCASKFKFLFARAIVPNATYLKLMVSHDLKEGSNVIIHSGHVKIATFVAGGLKPFDVNGFGEVINGICANSLAVMIFSCKME